MKSFICIALLSTIGVQACVVSAQYRRGEAVADTIRALIIFGKFKDDVSRGDRQVAERGWPLFDNPTRLPHFASSLLSSQPDGPYGDSTLTAYFHSQSNGRFVVFGQIVDSVLVSMHPERRYHRPDGGYGDLTLELLARIDPYVDFARFDENDDGIIDHIFIILRADSAKDGKEITWTGISCLDARCGPGVASGTFRKPPEYDGVRLDWNRSGSFIYNRTAGNVFPQAWLVRLMAHELGHDIWAPYFTHIPAIASNDVPREGNRPSPTQSIGYALMAGAGAGAGYDCGGSHTVSAFERDLLGWIDCEEPVASSMSVRLGDLYATGSCFKIDIPDSTPQRSIYVTNHQRLSWFDRYRRTGIDQQFEPGLLRTTGLLVTMREGIRFDVIPADNSLVLSPRNSDYEGDMFGRSRAQLTPWTRPAFDGYSQYPPGIEPSWHAIDDIRRAADGSGDMLFAFVQDFRERPEVRVDSHIGSESDGQTISGTVKIMGESTLTVSSHLILENGVLIDYGATLLVERESRITIPSGATVRLRPGATLRLDGTLILGGALIAYPGSTILRGAHSRIVSAVERSTDGRKSW